MIKRLFGETKEAQLAFLKKKMIITAILVIIAGIIAIFLPEAASIALAIAAYVWGWSFMGTFFGITTLGSIFAGGRNLFVGIMIFFLYLSIGYLFGIFAFIIGACRFIQLKAEQIRLRKEAEQYNKE